MLTTMPTPSPSARPFVTPKSSRKLVNRRPSVAPEKAPDSTPISVMPICTVERNLPGSDASASARREPLTPFSHSPTSRAGREETMASSDMESRPLTTIRTATIPSSRDNTRFPSWMNGPHDSALFHKCVARCDTAAQRRAEYDHSRWHDLLQFVGSSMCTCATQSEGPTEEILVARSCQFMRIVTPSSVVPSCCFDRWPPPVPSRGDRAAADFGARRIRPRASPVILRRAQVSGNRSASHAVDARHDTRATLSTSAMQNICPCGVSSMYHYYVRSGVDGCGDLF